MFDNRSQRNRREISEHGDDDHRSNEQSDKQGAMRWERPTRDRDFLLGRQAAGRRENRNQKQETADELCQSKRQVVPRRVDVNTSERASVVASATGVGIENFAQSMRATIVHIGYRGSGRIPISLLRKMNLRAYGAEN